MFLYSLTKFGILKPRTNIQSLRRFDLGLWQTWKQIYITLLYREQFFGEFVALPCIPRKMVLYFSTKFGILKPWTNFQSLRRIHLGLRKTSKQIHRKLQYRLKAFGEFQTWPRFPKKMVLYGLTKSDIVKPWTNIPWPRRFNLDFWQTSKQICRKLQYKENIFA